MSQRGEVFVTDSNAGAVYAASEKREGGMRVLLPAGSLSGPNGIAFFEEAGVLLVAHDVGIAAVDPRTGTHRDLARGPGQVLGSFDGIALSGRVLWGVQNGLGAPRVVRAELDGAGTGIVSLRTLETANPDFDIPTTGAVASDGFYFIANSHLRAIGPDGRIREPERLRDVIVLALPLDPGEAALPAAPRP